MPTLFSKIVAGELPAERIFEHDHWLAILDLYPVEPGHLLLVAKDEIAHVVDLSESSLAGLGSAIATGTTCLRRALNCPAVSVLIRDGAKAGQEIPHVHVHLVPRFASSAPHRFAPGRYADTDEEVDAALQAMGERLRGAL